MRTAVVVLILILAPVLESGPSQAMASPFVYVANTGANTVSVIDAATNTVVAAIPVGNHPGGVAVNPTGSRVYVSVSAANIVAVIDTTTNAVVATIPVGDNPAGLAVNPSGSRIYVANELSHTVSVIDATTEAVIATVGVGGIPFAVAVNPAERSIPSRRTMLNPGRVKLTV